MAAGDIVVFEEARATILDGGWESADDIKCAILDNTTAPAAADATPVLADYTEVGTAGTYAAGGTSLGNWGTLVTEAGGTVTVDSATNPSWAADASNDTDAYWALLYNDTQTTPLADPAFVFVDLGGPVDMSAITLTLTWGASGIFTIS